MQIMFFSRHFAFSVISGLGRRVSVQKSKLTEISDAIWGVVWAQGANVYDVSRLTLTAVGRSQLLARWPGTHSRIVSGIQRAAQTVLVVYLKRICSRITSASSALGVLSDYALYKSTHSLTHMLLLLERRAPAPKVVAVMQPFSVSTVATCCYC